MPTNTRPSDSIQKVTVLAAPRSRVWRALSDPAEFGAWFGVRLEGSFRPGARVRGRITLPGYEHVTLEMVIEHVQPEERLSYHWHPYAVDPETDYSAEPMTRVEFRLEDLGKSTRLTVTESGFDRIPPGRRDEAFRMNEGGWTQQLEHIRRHVTAG